MSDDQTNVSPAAPGPSGPGPSGKDRDPVPAPPAALTWAISLLALGAFAGSTALSYQSVGQPMLPGCGPESGCNQVLASEWSRWFGVPVAAPAALLYAVMFFASFFLGPARAAGQRRLAWAVLWIGAITALGAAIWFTGVQLGAIEALCRYCMGVHVTGGVLALLVLFAAPRPSAGAVEAEAADANPSEATPTPTPTPGPAPLRPFNPAALTLLGLIPLAVLGMGQFVQPAPETPLGRLADHAGAEATSAPPLAEGEVALLGGRLRFTPTDVPSLGSREAETWLVYLFDYTCSHCRNLHPQLTAAMERYDGRLGVIPLPVPLNADCNPLLENTNPAAEAACDLAMLAMAVWRADPDQFAAFDHWVFASDDPPSAEAARARAIELVGEQPLEEALDSGWPNDHVQSSISIYRHLGELTGRRAVPLMVVGDNWFPATRDAEALFYVLEEASDLEPPEGISPASPPEAPADE